MSQATSLNNQQPSPQQHEVDAGFGQSEERFRVFVTATSDAVYQMSADWQQMHLLVGKSFLLDTPTASSSWLQQYIPLPDQPQVQAAIEEAIATKTPFELTHRVVRADGSLGWTFSRAIPLLDKQGEITEWFGTASDITGQKQAQEALAQSEEKYRMLFNSIDEAVSTLEIIFDENNKAVDWLMLETNPAMNKMTGWTSEVVGQKASEYIPDAEAYWFEAVERVVKTGEPIHIEHPVVGLNDNWYEMYIAKVGGKGSRQVVCVYTNITARKRHEANLAFLYEVSQDFAPLLSAETIMQRVGQRLGRHLRLSRCAFSLVDDQANQITALYEWRREDVTASVLGSYPISALLTEAGRQHYRTGKLAVIPDTRDNWLTNAPPELLYQMGNRSIVDAPYVQNGRWTFLLTVVRSEPGEWRADETELIEELAARIYIRIDRALTEQALAASEEKYRWLFETMDLGFSISEAIRDENGQLINYRLRELNPAFTKLTGLDPVEALGKTILELLPGLDPWWLTTYQRVLDTQETIHFEQFVPQLHRWYEITAFYYGKEQFAVYYSDITGRKRHEASLTFLAEVGQGLAGLTNIDETMTELGAKIAGHFKLAEVVFGEMSDDEQTVHISHEWHRADYPAVKGTYAIKAYYSPEFERLHRAGQIAVVRDTANDERVDATGYAALGIGAFVNVPLMRQNKWLFNFTLVDANPRDWREDEIELMRELTTRIWTRLERARAEEALLDSQKRFESIANLVPDLLWDSQPDGSTNWYNQRWLEYTGQRFEEAIGWGWTEAIHPDDRAASAKQYREAVETGQSLRQEHWIRRYDGAYRWFVVSASPLKDERDQVVKMYGAATDIHESKLAEAALQESEKRLRLADRRKDEFLAMLAHELRNPMSTIRSGLQILSITDGKDQTSSDTIAMMNRQTDHLVRMVDDLLDVSRITQGKIELRQERVNLVGLVQQAVASSQPLFDEQGKLLHVNLASTSIELEGDATRLTQVVTNLLTNGARYTGEQGQVWLSLSHQHNEAILRVRDNGIGLAADQLSTIFDLFVQVDHSTARSKGGLGLGLTLVKRLVDMHGGHVDAQSDGIGWGSTFTVRLPTLTVAAEPTARSTPQATDSTTSRRILVVDDNADAGFTLAMLLKLKGYEVHTRNSGRTGLEAAEALHPAAILLDIGMPALDGYETCRLLREQAWGQAVVVIALTGYGEEEDRQQTKAAGFDGHLVKPVDLGTLTKLLTDLLDKDQNRAELA